jgi:protein NRD1
VEEFETILKELPTLKAPGVSGSRIKKLTELATKNVKEESKLITALYSNCKAAPSSHKLGTLYVVDSIVRGYTEEAKKLNETIDSSASEGTFAAGVYKISELIESLIDDAMELLISKSQTIKISKLVDIWERAETFSPEIIKTIRDKYFFSTTPPGTPPRTSVEPVKPKGDDKQDSNSILSALASLAKTSNSNESVSSPPPAEANSILSQLSALSQSSKQQASPPTQNAQTASTNNGQNGEMIYNMLQQMQNSGPQQSQQSYGNDRRGRDNSDFTSRRNRSRSPTRQVGSQYSNNQYGGNQQHSMRPPQGNQPYGNHGYGNQGYGNQGYGNQYGNQGYRSPPQNYQNYGNGPQDNYNQMQQHNAPFVPQQEAPEMNVPGAQHYRPRNVGFDQTLPQGSFKVLSRTLFIGGVPRTMDEHQLAAVLKPFAEVQSVILNSERKHAFVKVYSRREAEQVITSFNKDGQLPLRTRWGVGFGPRDCCNYQHGISIIPIQRLTDADRAWVVKAQWGGTGGEPLQSGIVIDEPDIEIGAGISSKAMSKKMPTNSARNGPKSNKPGEPDEEYVKTTLLGGRGRGHNQGHQPDFNAYNNNTANPLAGLFNNNSQPQYSQQPQQPHYPPNMGGAPPPNMNNPGFQDYMSNMQQNNGANLNALAGLFQNKQQ